MGAENSGKVGYNSSYRNPDAQGTIFENQIPCEWMSTNEAAMYLRISVNALRICVHRGQVQVHRFGKRRVRFKVADLRELLSTKGA